MILQSPSVTSSRLYSLATRNTYLPELLTRIFTTHSLQDLAPARVFVDETGHVVDVPVDMYPQALLDVVVLLEITGGDGLRHYARADTVGEVMFGMRCGGQLSGHGKLGRASRFKQSRLCGNDLQLDRRSDEQLLHSLALVIASPSLLRRAGPRQFPHWDKPHLASRSGNECRTKH
jgi:hypothetical protein